MARQATTASSAVSTAARRRGDARAADDCAAAATPVGPGSAIRRRHAPPLVRARAGPTRDRPAASDGRTPKPTARDAARVGVAELRHLVPRRRQPPPAHGALARRPRLAPRPFAGGRRALAPLSAAARRVAAAAAAHAAHGAAARAARAARCVAREWRGGRALVRCALARPAVWRGGALRTRPPHVARARAAAAPLHDVGARVALAIRTARTRRGSRRAFDAWWDRAAAQRSMRDAARAAASRTATLALLRATLDLGSSTAERAATSCGAAPTRQRWCGCCGCGARGRRGRRGARRAVRSRGESR